MNPLHVLIIDDSEADALLVARAIETGGFSIIWRRVENRASMAQALESAPCDVIISDYTMPAFTGLDALALWKERQLDVPFIIVSGVIDDTVAIAAMKAGARDCIRKSDLVRLAPAIDRELRETAGRRDLTRRYLAFSRLGQRLSSARSPQEAARIITNVADELIGWDCCFLILYAPTEEKFYHVFDVDIIDGKRCELPEEPGGSTMTPMLERVLRSGSQLILRGTPEFAKTELRPFGDKARPSASLMVVPVRNGQQVLGFLSIQSYTAAQYKKEDLSTLETLADYCAGALERIRAEDELRASERRYRVLFDSNPCPIFVFDRKTLQFLAVNEAAIHQYGYSREEFLAMTTKELRPAEEMMAFLGESERIKSNEKRLVTWRHQKKDGTIVDTEVTSLPLIFAEREARLSVVIDVSQRKKLEKEILEISGREQRRIGHDLHDGLCQQLAGIGFLSQILADELSEKSAPEAGAAEKINDLISESVAQTRNIARGLFPVRLEENGLTSALEQLAISTGQVFKVKCAFECAQPVLVRDNSRAENLYYIAHEAVANAVKHGKAKIVRIILETKADLHILSVEDDGIGFQKSATQDGMGLRIMNYRARTIGASLEIKPRLPKGTTVICSFHNPSDIKRSLAYKP